MKRAFPGLVFAAISLSGLRSAQADEMARIPAGTFQPFFKNAQPSGVHAFMLDRTQVTNADYLVFVQKHPEWRKSRAKRIFTDDAYLKHWFSDVSFPLAASSSPVNNVSFFAAKAYCAALGKRLPNLAEWEYAAGADPAHPLTDVEMSRILAWYGKPSTDIPEQTRRNANIHGVYDMHGLVWEWVGDFNSVMLSDESRESGTDKALFCGGGAMTAANFRDYAAYMRYAFRSSLRGNYSGANLGFRCAKDL